VVSMVDALRARGSWAGHTHLQKALFVCESLHGVSLGFGFTLYRYGPFSRQLERMVHRLEEERALTFVPQTPPYGPRLVTSEGADAIREAEPDALALYDAPFSFVADALASASIRRLEQLATILWFKVRHPGLPAHAIARLVTEAKPHISVQQALRVHDAVEDLIARAGELDLLPVDTSPDVEALAAKGDAPASPRPAFVKADPIGDDCAVPLIVDVASSRRRLPPEEFHAWAATRTVFLSSEMGALAPLRRQVSQALRQVGFSVVAFEDLGGRDEGVEHAYMDGVARSDVYVGIVADRYGTMLSSGRSPTHEEYREARRLGKRISVWTAADDSRRQGNAKDFVQEVRAFHTTGAFVDADDLVERLVERLAEIAADDEAPWIKLGDVCLRASRIRVEGRAVRILADIRDAAVARMLEDMCAGRFGRAATVSIATTDRAGTATVQNVVSDRQSTSLRSMELLAEVAWGPSGNAAARGLNGLSADDVIEAQLRAGLLREPLPPVLSGALVGMLDLDDPLAPLDGLNLTPAAEEAVGALLLSEWLLGGGRASHVERFALGPSHHGSRRMELVYGEPRRYDGETPATRTVAGVRTSP
jgi:uncharacterized protein YwgA